MKVKICGLSTPETLTAAIEGGADFVGFVSYPPSPRHVEPEIAAYLTRYVPERVATVGLFVDATDEAIGAMLRSARIDTIQLHGRESPERVAEIRARSNRPVIKVLAVRDAQDLAGAALYEDVADWLMLDAKPAGPLPGGNGQAFDWKIATDFRCRVPWMLAGGLDAGNVGAAIRTLRPGAVDVSSGVETAPGVKDAAKIREFLDAARAASI